MSYDYVSSLPAFHENKQGKDYCRSQVFTAIRKLQPCTDKQISQHINMPVHLVSARRNELVHEKKLVILAKKDTDPESKRTVSFWRVKEVNHQQVLF